MLFQLYIYIKYISSMIHRKYGYNKQKLSLLLANDDVVYVQANLET